MAYVAKKKKKEKGAENKTTTIRALFTSCC